MQIENDWHDFRIEYRQDQDSIKSALDRLRQINREAVKFRAEHKRWPRVLFGLTEDIFSTKISPGCRHVLLRNIRKARNIEAIILTSPIYIHTVADNVKYNERYRNWPNHIGLMITITNKIGNENDYAIYEMLRLKYALGIPWVGINVKSLSGYVDIENKIYDSRALDWVICSGETGIDAKRLLPHYCEFLHEQCKRFNVPFFFRNWGEWNAEGERVGWEKSGRILKGKIHDEAPVCFTR